MSGFLASLPGACAQGIIWGIMAVGVYLTFKVLDLADLTVDGSFGTGGAVLVVCTIAGMNIWLAMLLAFLAGCIAGLVTGILHTKFGIPAILAGILTQLALYSVNLRIMSGRANVALNIDEYGILVSLRYIPKSILVGGAFALVIIGLLYWFFGTELGAGVRATGCNEAMARANGINTGFNKVLGLVLSNGIVALSGGLLAQYQKSCDINVGTGMVTIALASLIIGETLVGKRTMLRRVLGVVFGSCLYRFIVAVALRFNVPAAAMKLVSAIIVAIAISMPAIKEKIAFEQRKHGACRRRVTTGKEGK